MEEFWTEERISETVIVMIKEYCTKVGRWSLDELETIFKFYMEQDETYKERYSKVLLNQCIELMKKAELEKDYYYIMSFLLYATKSSELYCDLLRHCIEDVTITKENKFFLYYQFVRFNFTNPKVVNEKVKDMMDDLYSCVYKEYYQEIFSECSMISKEERNDDFVLVLTSQILGMNHGPTKTLLDRCYILKKVLKKKVYIINTAEFVTKYGEIDFCGRQMANYNDELSKEEFLEYKDKKFAFFQCSREMPSEDMIREILEVVKQEKPYFIVSIGGNSIVSDMCSNLVPTITVSLVPSEKAVTRGQFQVIGRKISNKDLNWLKKHGYSKEHMIESLFTSAFKQQTHKYTRKELGLPQDEFIVVLVGARLDYEIDDACMQMLLKLMESGIYVVFMGVFQKFDNYAKENVLIEKYGIYLGMQDDVLAVNECCDLYLNPKRVGGGTSVAEALYKGLPVVTMDYGDGGLGAGKEFHVSDYEEMYEIVLRYATDKEFYKYMSETAKKRAKILMDSETEFVKIIETMEKSELFK